MNKVWQNMQFRQIRTLVMPNFRHLQYSLIVVMYLCFVEAVTDPEIKKEIAAYYEGKRRLAVMMGCDPDTFTEKDVDVRLSDSRTL